MFKIPLQISRSIEINKPANEIYKIISDLNLWSKWSPWSHIEPSAKIEVSGTAGSIGQKLTWDGAVTGSGQMAWVALTENKSLTTALEFFKPWKSKSQVVFTLEPAGNGTKVIWTMNSDLPLFMIFFKKMMSAFMGSDFDRGLKMLKELSESGQVCSQSKYLGAQNVKGFHYVAKRTSCKISDVSKMMSSDFALLNSYVKEGKLPSPKMALSMTHKWDFVTGTCEYSAAFAYDSAPTQAMPEGCYQGHYSDHKALQVNHFGSYKNLANGWAMAMSHQRALKHKINKRLPLYEMYITPPGSVSESELHTQISIPTV